MLLGATRLVRSGETSSSLVEEVHQLWGPPLDQAPAGKCTEQRPREEWPVRAIRSFRGPAIGKPKEVSMIVLNRLPGSPS